VTRFAVFGLGEAGSEIAAGLVAAGAQVSAFDPAPVATPVGVGRFDSPVEAVDGAAVVLGVTAAADAMTALTQALDAIAAGAVYADLSTSSAGAKRALADVAGGGGLGFVDVALMATVPGKGLVVAALASGPAAGAFVDTMAPLGMPVTAVGDDAGLAAARKLLRSVVMKGLAGLVIEAMRAAEAAGLAGETWSHLVDQVTAADGELLRRLVEGTGTHAERRLREMESTAQLLAELGVDPVMTRGTIDGLRRALVEGVPDLPG